MHYFAPKQAEKAWDSYKAAYRPYLLSLDASALCRQTGASYFTALNEEAESYYGAMMAAREMDDKEFFEALLTHLNQIAAPRLAEGKIWFDALGSCQDLHAFYILLAKSHIPWKLLLNHDWEHYYAYDFNEVR